jgi:hypothetical protein
MIALLHFRDQVVRPVLRALHLAECFDPAVMTAAERLLIGTALAESRLEFLAQVGGGPALGVYQMEPATHDDIWTRYLAGRPGLAARVRSFAWQGGPSADQMAGNLYYATAMVRIHYLRAPAKLPPPADSDALAAYWKRFYNTPAGKGTPEGFKRKAAAILQL